MKAVVGQCDAARAEVSERLIDELLALQAGAATTHTTAEQQPGGDDEGLSAAAVPELEPEPEPEPELEPEPEPELAAASSRQQRLEKLLPYAVPAPVAGAPHLLQPRHTVSLGTDCFGRTVRCRCCLLCIYMPAIDRPLPALYIHAGD